MNEGLHKMGESKFIALIYPNTFGGKQILQLYKE